MKKLFYLFAALLTVALVGCNKGDEAKDAEPEEIKLAVEPNAINCPAFGGDYSITLTSPASWTATCSDSWVKVDPLSGEAGTKEIRVKIMANSSSAESNSKIVFKAGEKTVELPVKRAAKEPARLRFTTEKDIQTPKEGGTYTIQVESNIKWEVSTNVAWAKIDGTAVKQNNDNVTVTVEAATKPEETMALIVVSPFGEGEEAGKDTVVIVRGSTEATSLTINKTQIKAPADGGDYSIIVQSNAKWHASKSWDADWLTIKNGEGVGNGAFGIKINPATSGNATSTVVTVEEVRTDDYKPVQLNLLITREGKAAANLSVSPLAINAPAEGGEFAISITCNYSWTATMIGTKIFSVSTTSGDGNATMIVTVKPATSNKEETGSVTISSSYGGEQAKINIHREAKPEPEPEPEPEPASKYTAKPFSVSTTKKVYISPGNLQYRASTDTWRFAENQYLKVSVCGRNGNVYWNGEMCDNDKISATYDGWIDRFGWGTGANPTYHAEYDTHYNTFTDWSVNPIQYGSDIYSPGVWHTPSADEWSYLLSRKKEGKNLKACAVVNNVQGLILLPDDWVFTSAFNITTTATYWGSNKYSLEQWQKYEAVGAIFLPRVSYCGGGLVDMAGRADYWSSDSKYLFYTDMGWSVEAIDHRYYRRAVRLIRDAE